MKDKDVAFNRYKTSVAGLLALKNTFNCTELNNLRGTVSRLKAYVGYTSNSREIDRRYSAYTIAKMYCIFVRKGKGNM